MTSERVFLDADVLAAPMTRNVLVLASLVEDARFMPQWSLAAQTEADRAVRPGQTRVAELRGRFEWGASVLVEDATREDMDALHDTSTTDRHILAAAHAAGIRLLVTRNVHDFGRDDLAGLGVSAVHPDLFMSYHISEDQCRETLELMADGRLHPPPNTPKLLHAALGAEHPRLFEAMHGVYPGTDPSASTHAPPAEVFRGDKCLVCGKTLSDPESHNVVSAPSVRGVSQPERRAPRVRSLTAFAPAFALHGQRLGGQTGCSGVRPRSVRHQRFQARASL